MWSGFALKKSHQHAPYEVPEASTCILDQIRELASTSKSLAEQAARLVELVRSLIWEVAVDRRASTTLLRPSGVASRSQALGALEGKTISSAAQRTNHPADVMGHASQGIVELKSRFVFKNAVDPYGR
jgi:hypothetical protein